MSGYIGPQPVPQAVITRQVFTVAADGTTSFATKGYTVGYVDVYLNGVRLVNGDDYTATNGSDIVLASSAYANDVLEMVALRPFQALNQNLAGTTTTDRLVATGQMDMPTWTTAGRPASPQIGTIGYNTTIGALENYTAQGWLKVSVPIPVITSSSGTIYSGVTSTITLSGLNFGTSTATVTFTSGATTATATATPTNGGQTCAVSVPAAIYGLAGGAAVSVTLKNADNVTSAALILTIVGLPTGGTITTSGGYRIHTFTSSGSLSVPAGFSTSAQYLIVAGGGGGGGGGGGAGGLLSGSTTLAVTTTYSVTVGSGGTGGTSGSSGAATNGGNSTALSLTAIGGGAASYAVPGTAGGSGGGGGHGGSNAGGAGTSGQGYAGGTGFTNSAGGGGGAGAVGATATSNVGGNGGVGLASSITGSSVYYAGGGGGGSTTSGSGGNGGGGAGAAAGPSTAGTANTGGGGGGIYNSYPAANGGSGIVIVRYPLPT